MRAADSGGVRHVLRNTAVLAVAKVLERLIGFVVALMIGAALGTEGFGIYATAWGFYGMIVLLGEAGTTSYLVREISREPARTAAYTLHLSAIAVGISALLILLAEIGLPHLGYASELETSVSVVLLAILPRVLNGVQEAVFVAHGRVEFETITRMVTSAGYVSAVAWLLSHEHGVSAVLRALVLSEYTVALVYFVLINRSIARLRLRLRWRLVRRILGEIRPYTASTLLAALFARPEVVILSLFVSASEVGLYGAAMRIAELPLLVPEVLMINVFPLMARAFGHAEERFMAWQSASIRAMLAFSLPLAALLVAAPSAIVTAFFGESFAGAADLLRILAVTLVAGALNSVLWRSLAARGRQGTNVRVQLATVTVRLGAGVPLAALVGPVGAACSSASSTALHTLLLATVTTRSGAPARLLAAAWRPGLAALCMAVPVWLLADAVPIEVLAPIGGVSYLLAAMATGVVTAEDRALLRRLVAARRTRADTT